MFQLLRDYEGQRLDGRGFLMSEKLDGWRILWTGSQFILRGGGVLDVPDEWKTGMPAVALDGELFAGRGEFNTIQGRMRDGWHGLTFRAFDAPSEAPFRARYKALTGMSLPSHCQLVKQVRCLSTKHLVEFADGIVQGGGEGAVVRDGRAPYIAGRTEAVLRWVPQCPRVNRRKAA